ncbi:protein spindle-F [Venturia canescens]|uniref:protein spindle-F n=1 Tax=Venturia canescens TaxID=32260 RepID=UPI001C9D2EA3|nr:protein spindle-F [Venturia canescens]
MSIADMGDMASAQHALQIAFQTMQERCQQLQKRLTIVEEENMGLRIERGVEKSDNFKRDISNDATTVANLQKKVEELSKQKSQLTHHVFMVAAENRQLWSRLTRLTRTNKKLDNQLTKTSDSIKQNANSQPLNALTHSFKDVGENPSKFSHIQISDTVPGNSLEEISLRLINSIMMEKSELEQQCTEMVEMQNGADINLQNVGFTYPEDSSMDSLQQLKQHDLRLSQTKDTLASQQIRLKRVIRNLRKMRRSTVCKNCKQNASKTTCQIGTQFDSDDSLKEHGATQTSLPPPTNPLQETRFVENFRNVENGTSSQNICPLCGLYFESSTIFEIFHEHVLSHFTEEKSLESFEIVH